MMCVLQEREGVGEKAKLPRKLAQPVIVRHPGLKGNETAHLLNIYTHTHTYK